MENDVFFFFNEKSPFRRNNTVILAIVFTDGLQLRNEEIPDEQRVKL